MRVRSLIEMMGALIAINEEYGDVPLEMEYWCVDCKDFHTSKAVNLKVTNGVLSIEASRMEVEE